MAPFTFGHSAGTIVTLVIGFFFGFVLERAGFGNAGNLAAQFYLYDMRVLKVMFTGDRHGDAVDLLRLGPRIGRFRPGLGAIDLFLAGRAGRIHPRCRLYYWRILPGNVAGGRLHVQARRHRLCRRRALWPSDLRGNGSGVLGILQSCRQCRTAYTVRLAGPGCRPGCARRGPDGGGRVRLRRDHGEGLRPPRHRAQAVLTVGKSPPSFGCRRGGDYCCRNTSDWSTQR